MLRRVATSSPSLFKITPSALLGARNYAKSKKDKRSIAVVLSGCGYLDGTEISEAVSASIHISQRGFEVAYYAPNIEQTETVDHNTKKTESNEVRNVMDEAARIARSNISPLKSLDEKEHEAVVFPGGFGVAKNLSNFAFKAPAEVTVHPEVEKVLKDFHKAKKPIGLACIAPILAARVFGTAAGGPGVQVTVGKDAKTIEAIDAFGAKHEEKEVTDALLDEKNRIVTTPAYMTEAPVHKIHEGIGKMIDEVVKLAGSVEGEVDLSLLDNLLRANVSEAQYKKFLETKKQKEEEEREKNRRNAAAAAAKSTNTSQAD